jgi:hypothetical protein
MTLYLHFINFSDVVVQYNSNIALPTLKQWPLLALPLTFMLDLHAHLPCLLLGYSMCAATQDGQYAEFMELLESILWPVFRREVPRTGVRNGTNLLKEFILLLLNDCIDK